MAIRHQSFVVTRCPSCGRAHEYKLQISTTDPAAEAAHPVIVNRPSPVHETPVLMFAGVGQADATAWDVLFDCPTSNRPYTQRVELPDDLGTVTGASSQLQHSRDDQESSAKAIANNQSGDQDATDTEYSDWIKNSAATARDFGKTMVATASGSVPIYFAVLKYLGFDRVGQAWNQLTVIPPFLLLASVILFALALRPSLLDVTREQFQEVRRRRLQRLNKYILAGTFLFCVSMIASTTLFAVLMLGGV